MTFAGKYKVFKYYFEFPYDKAALKYELDTETSLGDMLMYPRAVMRGLVIKCVLLSPSPLCGRAP